MKVICRTITFLVSFIFLIGSARCTYESVENARPVIDHTPSPTVAPTDLLLETVGDIAAVSSPTIQPSPTPWLRAFSQVTRIPVNFWWSEAGAHLYYEENQCLWQYDPATGEAIDITSEAPIYGQPLPSVQSRIPDQVLADNVYFAPSGVQALFVLETYYYEGGTPSPNVDGEVMPSEITSEVWYIAEEELKPRRLGAVNGLTGIATWSQDEKRVLLPILDDQFFPYGGSSGWIIALPDGRMWKVFAVSSDYDYASSDQWYMQMAPDGQKALSVGCTYSLEEIKCEEYWLTSLKEESTGHREPIEIPSNKWDVRLLPNNRGLIAFDGIVIYLHDFAGDTWLQLNDTHPPYMWMSAPMDPPGETMRAVKFSSDAHYIAWNGPRGLQVFSLCPGGGELLDCE